MVNVNIELSGSKFSFFATGHADHGKKGQDIVCAGISAICMAVDKRIQELELLEKAKVKRRFIEDGGYYIAGVGAEETILTALAGLKDIQRYYPNNLLVVVNKLEIE